MFDSSMDKKRPKRAKSLEDGTWDCSVCTFKNSAEAFKCAMCDVRKGTSTRKPKPNPELVAQQVAQQLPPAKREKTSGSLRRPERGEPSVETDTSQDSHRSDTTDHQEHKKSRSSTSSESRRLRNIDRRSGVSMEVTVNGVTVVVTDYKPKIPAAMPSSSKSSRPSVDGHTSHDSTSSHAPLSPNLHLNQSNSSTLSFSSTTGQQNLTDGNNSDKIDSD